MTATLAKGWFVSLTLIAMVGCEKASESSAKSKDAKPIVVTLAPIVPIELERTVSAVGTLYGYEEVMLAPKVDGRVVTIRADVGDLAIPGGVLLELDSTDYRLGVAEAREAVNAELAKLDLTELPVGEFSPDKVPAVRRASVGVEDAKRRFKLKSDLLSRSAVSRDEYDIAETDVRLAEAGLAQAVTEARSILAAARLRQASLEVAEQKLRDCQLTVPVPPRWTAWAALVGPAFAPQRYAVAERMVSQGEMVRSMPVTNAFRLVIDFALKFKAPVAERFAGEIQVGQAVELTVEAYPGRIFKGSVGRVNPTVDPVNRTFLVEVDVPNASGTLKCGGFARAQIRTRTDARVLTVPHNAIVTFAGVNKIFVVENKVAKAIEVSLGQRDKEWIEVSGAIPAGAIVITSGLSQVVDGSSVRERE